MNSWRNSYSCFSEVGMPVFGGYFVCGRLFSKTMLLLRLALLGLVFILGFLLLVAAVIDLDRGDRPALINGLPLEEAEAPQFDAHDHVGLERLAEFAMSSGLFSSHQSATFC